MATVNYPSDEAAASSGRLATFARMSGIGRRERAPKYGKLDRILVFLAFIMLPAGIAAIVLGWLGAANTPFIFEQIPYLISGGLLGIGLLFAGGLLYVGSWLARLAEQSRDEADKVRELIEVLRADLAATPGRAVEAVSRSEAGLPAHVVATPTGTMYHLASCAVVAGRDDLREIDPDDEPGMRPCKMCAPLD